MPACFQWLSSLDGTSMIAVVQLRLLSIQTRSQPMRKKFPQAQKHRKRVMGYRVRQPILCIGEWQSLQNKAGAVNEAY